MTRVGRRRASRWRSARARAPRSTSPTSRSSRSRSSPRSATTGINGGDIAPEEPAAERTSFGEVILRGRLEEALCRLNPDAPQAAIVEALRKVTMPEGASLLQNNRPFHRMLRDGVEVESAGKKAR